ncbi:uncharacterized protein LOC144166620 [Haemaphysalis longicornis]
MPLNKNTAKDAVTASTLQLRAGHEISSSIVLAYNNGDASVVNLWDEADRYIEQLKRELHNIDGWGLTGDYAYWNRTPAPQEHPIYGIVEKMECLASSIETDRETVPPTECTREIVWNITHRIRSPFHLNVTVLVPMISRSAPKQNVTLDINNHTVIIMRAQPRQNIPKKREVRKIVKKSTTGGMHSLEILLLVWMLAQLDEGMELQISVGSLKHILQIPLGKTAKLLFAYLNFDIFHKTCS